MQVKNRILASAFESGERVLQLGEKDVKLVDSVTNFYLVAEKPISITLSDGTVFDKMTQFMYGGANPVSVSISAGCQASKVTYSAGVKVKCN